jgi:hypothetical protein
MYALHIVQRMYVGSPYVCYFLNTLWVIPGCTRYPLDHCAKTTGRTLRLPNVCCSIRESVANFPNK